MNDYERVARVIRHLDQHHATQPSLAELAAISGLSASHFHRLFQRWVGVTPKDFLQCLTMEHAKGCLRTSANVLDASLEAGLSGPGRLHDLFVTLEAASPGEFKRQGAGLDIEWGRAPSPFGWCALGWNSRGICHLSFRDEPPDGAVPRDLVEAWPRATFRRNDCEAARCAALIFRGRPQAGRPLKAFVRATAFQLKVWRALLRIPEGCVASYRTVAEAIKLPGAARAVGAACGANPIAYLIPCHRVIRETGVVRGYRWGDVRKQAMLAREAVRHMPAAHQSRNLSVSSRAGAAGRKPPAVRETTG